MDIGIEAQLEAIANIAGISIGVLKAIADNIRAEATAAARDRVAQELEAEAKRLVTTATYGSDSLYIRAVEYENAAAFVRRGG